MRYFLLVATILFLQNMAHSQQDSEYILKLRREILQSKKDTATISLFLKLSNEYTRTNAGYKAISAALQAKALSESLHYPQGVILAISEIGVFYETSKKDYASAVFYYRQAQKVAEENHITEGIYRSYSQLLNIYFYAEDLSNAMLITTKGMQLAAALNDKTNEAKYLSLAGFIYLKRKDSIKTKEYYEKYLHAAFELKDSLMLADAYNSMADAYSLSKNYKPALQQLFTSLNIYKRFNNTERIAYTYSEIGSIYQLQNKNEAAKLCLLNTFKYLQIKNCNKYDLAHYYLIIGNIYANLLQFKQAAYHLHTGLTIAKQIGHRENIKDGYEYLTAMFAKQEKYDSAYRYNVLYNNLKDSIANEEVSKAVEQIHTRFEVERKDKEIISLNQQRQIQQLQIKKQNTLRNIIIAGFLLTAVVSVLLYSRKQLKEKNIFQTKLLLQQKEMFNAMQLLQDKERKRIAEDIHDGIGSILSTAKLQLSGLEENKDVFTQEQLERYYQSLLLIDEASQELRNVSHRLMPATLSKIGLIAALQNLFDKMSTVQKLSVKFITAGFTARLHEEIEISIYYIILEIINNTIKHAGATEIVVQLIKFPTYINIVAEDNGVGFDYNRVMENTTSGIGLKNIISRVEYLKGSVHIDSAEGKGTSVLIDIPD